MNAWLKSAVAVLMATICVSWAVGKELNIPSFPTDPSGPAFTIRALLPGEGLTSNLASPAELTYGVTSQPDQVSNCLRMAWQPTNPLEDTQAGWRLAFGSDPDLTNHVLTVSILPPGAMIQNPNPPPAQLFVGVSNVSICITDAANKLVGGWGFNTDQTVNAVGPGTSLYNNWMQNVMINIGNGPVANSAQVMGGPVVGPPRIGPDFIVAGNGGSLANAATLDFYENGNLRGQVGIPNQLPFQGMVNFWDHVTLTPEPGALTFLGLLTIVLFRRR